MAVTAATLVSDFNAAFSQPEVTGPIFERAARMSVVQQLVPQVPLGPNGKVVPVITGRPTAGWVAEGARKPATSGTVDIKTMTPKKLAAIVVTSMEVVRSDPAGYVARLRGQLAESFAVAFDYASLHNLGGDGTGTGPFSTYIDQTTKTNELGASTQTEGGIYKDLVDSIAELVSDTDATGRRYKATGFALDDQMEPRLLGSVDTTGRPIWVDLPADEFSEAMSRPGSLLGRRSYMGEGVANPASTILGYVGDWTQAAWGVVGGISFSVSDQAPVTINGSLVSTWENNLVALRAEAEYGFLVNDVDAFVQLRNNTGS